MHEHELWLTALFNDHLAGVANSILGIFHITAKDPVRPWENWIVMELLVVAILIVLFAILRSRFSVENPGKLQHIFEVIWEFMKSSADEVGIHQVDPVDDRPHQLGVKARLSAMDVADLGDPQRHARDAHRR